MYHVTVGSDTYGRVKKVGSTPIVTKFEMVSSVPLYPLESYYFVRFGETTSEGIPFIVESRSTEIEGIPLARVDRMSVGMAYARGLFGAMAVVGFMATFVVVLMRMLGEQSDEMATIMGYCFGACLVVGVFAGLSTYVIPFQMTNRERDIRRACGTMLGISADPARVRLDYAHSIERFLNGLTIVESSQELVRELVRTRLRIALGEPQMALQDHTNDLLEKIRIHESASA